MGYNPYMQTIINKQGTGNVNAGLGYDDPDYTSLGTGQSMNSLKGAPNAATLGGLAIPGALLQGGGLYDYNTAQQMLQQARKYDPNASLTRLGDQTGDIIGADQGPGYTQFQLNFDKSKLPKFQGAGAGDMKQYGGWRAVDTTGQNKAEIANNPNLVVHDPNYGDYTVGANLKANPNDKMDSTWNAINIGAHVLPGLLMGGMPMLAYGAMSGLGNSMYNGAGLSGMTGMLGNLAGGMTGMPIGQMMSIMNMIRQHQQGKG